MHLAPLDGAYQARFWARAQAAASRLPYLNLLTSTTTKG
jgi:hypothetical protein